MKTDKELLELAAKAAGVDCDSAGPFVEKKEWVQEFGISGSFELVRRDWNPLKDDGDAFRLAVKLDMQVDIGAGEVWVMHSSLLSMIIESLEDADPYAATRRAIVRVAAAIGERL